MYDVISNIKMLDTAISSKSMCLQYLFNIYKGGKVNPEKNLKYKGEPEGMHFGLRG